MATEKMANEKGALKVLVLHGPNLNLLGTRQPEIYGGETLADVNNALASRAEAAGVTLAHWQSNHEGELIDAIQAARDDGTSAIIINPAAYTHTSVAILDALNAFDGTVIEVHISNVHKREAFRHHSYVSLRADGVIAGLGTQGYHAALDAVMAAASKP
ncbi:type II 3-dehydroquinate dehydratase [Vreelandella subglaciescola]|jgi:3-dehydroquinate dehydratase-2|uniref:3-dehydroquinate dehydratase n=1 Tax=Vreelandella subglaciescola TaxID=29571 RepID=A0A1M7H1H9_9GAMM|nr:type II 3-dehydroquinate dehydratase [Halomonas subglaciescola]SHM22445.1 3-dehydroquinate dehydratase [Halomonas subglaciescola]